MQGNILILVQLASQSQADNATRFLDSQNPALMKRNVLASFTNILLLPVTIVPRTVGALVTTGSSAAVSGISMLNPQRWGAQATNGYSKDFENKDEDALNETADEHGETKPSCTLSRSFRHRVCGVQIS